MLMRHLAISFLFIFSVTTHAQVPTSVLKKAMESKPKRRKSVQVTDPTYIRYEELEKAKKPTRNNAHFC